MSKRKNSLTVPFNQVYTRNSIFNEKIHWKREVSFDTETPVTSFRRDFSYLINLFTML